MNARIVHVASGREWRGGQNQVRLLARALARRGDIDQVVVTGESSELARRLTAAGVPVRKTAWRAALDPRALVAVWREVRTRPTILHAHDAHALLLAGLVSQATHARLVATRRVIIRRRRPSFWARADRVIAISHAVAAILKADGVPEDRITLVHSGIDPDEVRSASPAAVRAFLGLAPNLPLVVNVAALVPHKDHATLIAAAALLHSQVPDLHWVIAGEGALRVDLGHRVREAGLERHVHFLGHVSNPWGVMAEADVFVMSSRGEALGTSVLDALALGVPVVATGAGGIPEILAGGAGVIVPVGDVAALAGAVKRLLADGEQRECIRQAGRQKLEQFTDSAMAEQVRSVYRSILSTG